ncbi:DUF4350 domain-containing protein [Actinoallomurus rhizosphaericola]|uniref:DUF4350 domain-containing protein n=1 Tax=Actinoallomurus rhizosphaericola TaxID=2952536 RepID=UPI0020922552|nr:DUF4350 domain-containing protein [Actinoallomurus rhizosphaericola]MCO5998749.1 DUF4350 domain-containing protein [Actinoallomurus rhizosphaericola]
MTALQAPPVGEPATAGQVARRRWRRSRGILVAVLALLVLGVLLALMRPRTGSETLDPDSPGQQGARALAEITRRHGTPVTVVHRAADAADRLRAQPGSVLVVVRSERLVAADLTALRGAPGDRLLVAPSSETLTALAPGVEAAGSAWGTPEPGCTLPAAAYAGDADFLGATTYKAPGEATRCYFDGLGDAGLVQLPVGGATVTVLGSSRALMNEHLAEHGNAALAMNLIEGRAGVVWLMPDLPAPGSGGHKSFAELLPFGVKLAVLQIVIAVVLVALWRSRRLGPVVVEPLPVVVRSAEAVEGRARLYRSRRAADRAAEALRAGALERLTALLGMPRSAASDPAMAAEIVAAVAAHTGREQAVVGAALYGPPPMDDAGLVSLAGVLDDLERLVRNS